MTGNVKRWGVLTADGGYPASAALDGTETTSWVQGGVTVTGTLQDIADLGGGGGVSDGDKGDVTVSGSGTVWTVDNNAISNAKLADVATATIKGRSTAGTGDPEDLTAAQAATLLQGDGLAVTDAGFRIIPQNSQSAAYTLVASDSGKHIYHPSADTTARIWTIPANASVAYPIGTALTFINDSSAGVVTIAITSDTLVLAGSGSTGSRTLAANGMATAVKITTTRWMISGTGLT